eukprot:386357-Prorocentrum_minimum.AAC.1
MDPLRVWTLCVYGPVRRLSCASRLAGVCVWIHGHKGVNSWSQGVDSCSQGVDACVCACLTNPSPCLARRWAPKGPPILQRYLTFAAGAEAESSGEDHNAGGATPAFSISYHGNVSSSTQIRFSSFDRAVPVLLRAPRGQKSRSAVTAGFPRACADGVPPRRSAAGAGAGGAGGLRRLQTAPGGNERLSAGGTVLGGAPLPARPGLHRGAPRPAVAPQLAGRLAVLRGRGGRGGRGPVGLRGGAEALPTRAPRGRKALSKDLFPRLRTRRSSPNV